MHRTRLTPLLAALTLSLGYAAISSLPAQAEEADKAVRVRDAAPANDAIKLQVTSDKSAYRVDEPIRLKVNADKPFYLYVYSVDPASGNAWLLLPNKQQPNNHFSANQWFKVPGPNLEFVSDRPGSEKFVVVASAKKVDIDPMKLASKGDFAETKSVDLESSFEAKGIKIRDANAPQAEGAVVKRMEVKILGKGERAGADGDSPVTAFVSTAKDRFQEGERMNIVYGASEPGWVHLYVVDPDGTRSLVKRQQVKGDEQLKISARAEAPFGKHFLVAAFSKTEEFDEAALDRVSDVSARKDALDKGIRFDDDAKNASIAVKAITIQKY